MAGVSKGRQNIEVLKAKISGLQTWVGLRKKRYKKSDSDETKISTRLSVPPRKNVRFSYL